MTDTCAHMNWSCRLGMLCWVLSIAASVAVILNYAVNVDPFAGVALLIPLLMLTAWLGVCVYWLARARPVARRGRDGPELVIAAISWTLGTLFLLLPAGLMLLG